MSDLVTLGGDARAHASLEPLLTPLDALTPHPQNARRGKVGEIVESITANGVYRPLFAQTSTGHILAGNHTLQALQRMGADKAPVVWLDVDDDRARRIMLADNRVADLGEYDDQALADLLSSMDDLTGTGYEPEDLDVLLSDLAGIHTADTLAGTEDNYKEQYGVTVICDDAAHQEQVYNQLTAEGLTCRVVTV